MLLCSFSRCCSAPAASSAPGALTETKESVFSPFGGGRITKIFSIGRAAFFHHEKRKKKGVFFLLIIIFSTSRAKSCSRGVSRMSWRCSCSSTALQGWISAGCRRDGSEDSSCPCAQCLHKLQLLPWRPGGRRLCSVIEHNGNQADN